MLMSNSRFCIVISELTFNRHWVTWLLSSSKLHRSRCCVTLLCYRPCMRLFILPGSSKTGFRGMGAYVEIL